MSTSKIEIRNLTVDYIEKKKNFTALKNVSFPINDGEFVSYRCKRLRKIHTSQRLEGINKPAEGEVLIDGEKVNGTGSNRSVVFQHYSLFPWMTTRKNVAFGIQQVRKELSRTQRLQVADEFLDKVGLSEFRNKYPSQLSR